VVEDVHNVMAGLWILQAESGDRVNVLDTGAMLKCKVDSNTELKLAGNRC
jgi:hypothetical protein